MNLFYNNENYITIGTYKQAGLRQVENAFSSMSNRPIGMELSHFYLYEPLCDVVVQIRRCNDMHSGISRKIISHKENWEISFLHHDVFLGSKFDRIMFRSSHIFVFWFLIFQSLWLCCVIFFPFFFFYRDHIALQNLNKDFIICL